MEFYTISMTVVMVVRLVVDECLSELLSCSIRGGSLAEHEMSSLTVLSQRPARRRDGKTSRSD